VAGGIAIAVILVLFPVVVAMSGAAMAALLGAVLDRDSVTSNPDSEYLDLPV
jgi:hypothetical protein